MSLKITQDLLYIRPRSYKCEMFTPVRPWYYNSGYSYLDYIIYINGYNYIESLQ